MDGSYLPSSTLNGKRAVVVFWAEWCSYSRQSIARIEKIAGSPEMQDVEFIAASVDKAEDAEKVAQFTAAFPSSRIKYAFSGNDVYDEAFMAFDGGNLPHIFIINQAGIVDADGHSVDLIGETFTPPNGA